MVHGAFCGGWAFENFRTPFEAAGHRVLTPDLPGRDGKRGPSGLSMRDYAEAVAEVCRACEIPPILIGHSLGGLVACLASSLAPISGLVLLAPSAPWGISGSSMEEGASAFGLFALGPYWLQAVQPDATIAQQFSLDRMPEAARKAAIARMTPESGRALFETLNWWLDPMMTTQVTAPSAPVLVMGGGRDVIHPPATVRQTAQRLGGTFQLFEAMSHWLPGEPGWEDVAQACLTWISDPPSA